MKESTEQLLPEKMIGAYQVGKRIATLSGAHLYHARLEHGERVVLKQPKSSTLLPTQLSRFVREYELLRLLDVKGIVKARALAGEQTRPVIVLDYFDGESLETALGRTRLEVGACLRLGAELAHTLADLHAAGIMHRDIRPANLWLTPQQQHLLLLDLSLASEMQGTASRDNEASDDWAYRSPEQTGRMNRPADYRTDIYSLGITLYRMLTGRLPFTAEDPLEWVHCHVARLPPPPRELVPEIPQLVSGIVLKLLAKLPEDRYQSMRGVQCDLDRCLTQWRPDGEVAPFALGSEDFSGQFYIPRKLYGREREAASLHNAFAQMAETGQPALVTVSGYAGIGKSALVNGLQQPIVRERGYFISGKFDQYAHDIPYATLRQALQDLIRQLLAESETRIAQWRHEIQAAVGEHGRLVVDLLPQLEWLIGPQPAMPALAPTETQNRFRRVFRQFLAVLAKATHPLVLFFDDLQWIDAASLQFIESLLTHADTRYLLLIGAYRDNEVPAAHTLLPGIETMRRAGVPVQEIVLAPLPRHALNRLVADTLHASPRDCELLTRLIFDKTEGNPFFFIQFLTGLYKEGLLRYDTEARTWRWELKQIQDRNFADNIVDLMLGKLRRLPVPTQKALQLAACLGNKFTLAHLALISEVDTDDIRQRLSTALSEGLVMLTEVSGRFLHDRIQQAAYTLIPEQERDAIHLSIGRVLARHLRAADMAEHLFDVANQFNRGAALLSESQEKARAAELNLRAGRKAKASGAYVSARVYLAAGTDLLNENDWKHRYKLVFALWLERANCEFLSGNLDTTEQLIAMLLQHRVSKIDQAAVYDLKIQFHSVKSENELAVESALTCLRLFDIDFTPHPTDEQVRIEYEMVWQNLAGRSVDSLIDLPLMTKPEMRASLRILSETIPPALYADQNLLHLLLCRMINISFTHGVSDASTFGYAWFGVTLGSTFHRYHEGYQFCKLAVDLIERHGFAAFRAKACISMEVASLWTQPISSAIDFVRAAFRTGMETGDLTITCYSCNHLVTDLLLRGDHLNEVGREVTKGLDFVLKTGFSDVSDVLVSQRQFIYNMRGQTTSFSTFDDAHFNEASFEARLTTDRMTLMVCWYWIIKTQARFLSGNYETALDSSRKAESLLWVTTNLIQLLDYRYYTALTLAAMYEAGKPEEQNVWRDQLMVHQSQLREWAENFPPTFRDKHLLVSAEVARIEGRDLDAMRLYQQAIVSAHDHGFVQNEGIAYECASRFYRARSFDVIADTYIREASDCFVRWGAHGKVAQLETSYPALRTNPVAGTVLMGADSVAQLDVLSVTKASQAISGHIELKELIDALMRIVLETAGAQKASLLLVRNERCVQVADVCVDQQMIRVQSHLDQLVTSLLPLPTPILNYVRRTLEKVLLADASQPHVFLSSDADDYFIHHHPKSVLCLPILRRNVLVGLLYLENSLITDAFTPERLAVLDLLAAQAAISLENTLLYTDLKRENSERKRTEERLREREGRIRRLVESNIIGIFFWNLYGDVSEANDAFLRLTGYSREELHSGKIRWADLTPSEYAAVDALAAEQLQRAGVCAQYEKEILRRDGSRVPVLIGGTLLEGSQDCGVAFVVDVSERARVEAALRKAHDELEMRVRERTAELNESNHQLRDEIFERQQAEADLARSNAELEQLAYVASHDLQEPLRMVASYLQLLEQRYEKSLDADAHEFIGFAVNGAKRMQSLINDLLTYSRIGTKTMPSQPVDCTAIMTTVLHSLRMAIAEGDARITCGRLPVVMADVTQLTQLFQNLLANAIKFRREKLVRIHIAAERDGEFWRFSVQDSGVGIAPEYFERIFVMFQRLHSQRRYAGTGIGLAICKKIVERHGGRIWVESVPGQGSTFYFTLPDSRENAQ